MNTTGENRTQVYKSRAIVGVKWTSAASLLSTGLYLLQSIVLARLLEPRDFGLMAMAIVVISVAVAYVDMGLSSAIIQRQHCTEKELSSLYWLNIFAGIIVFCSVFALSPLIAQFYREPKVTHIVQLCALTFVLAPIGQQYQLLLQKELFFRPLALIEVASRGIGTAVAIAVAVMGGGVYALVFGQLATYASSSLLLVIRGHRIYRPRLHFAWADVRSYLGFGLYQMGERGINTLHDNLDKLIIGFWLGAKTLGYYSFAWNLALMPVSRINPILTKTAFPLFSRLQDEIALLRAGYFKLLRLLSLVNFPLFLGLCAVAPLAVPCIFGEKWLPAVPLVQVFSLVAVFYAIGNPIGSLVLAKGRADLGFWWNASISAVQAIAVALSAWLGGVMAVAVTLLVLQVLYFPASYHFLIKRVIGKCWRQFVGSVAPPLACAGVMFCLLKLTELAFPHHASHKYVSLFLLIALGGVAYLLAALAATGKDVRDLIAMTLHRDSDAVKGKPGEATQGQQIPVVGVQGLGLPDGK